jgi:hypothetical protein
MPAKLLLLILALTITAVPQSTPAPYSVKADKLGENLAEWKTNNPRSAKCDDTVLDDLPRSGAGSWLAYCLTRDWKNADTFTYANAPLLTETAWFLNGSLQKVDMFLLNSDPLADVLAGLKTKFGKPASKQATHVQNGFGSRFEQKRLTWTNHASTLELIYSSVPGTRPRLTFTFDLPRNETHSQQTQTAKACADM